MNLKNIAGEAKFYGLIRGKLNRTAEKYSWLIGLSRNSQRLIGKLAAFR
jgi:hypothetical protein